MKIKNKILGIAAIAAIFAGMFFTATPVNAGCVYECTGVEENGYITVGCYSENDLETKFVRGETLDKYIPDRHWNKEDLWCWDYCGGKIARYCSWDPAGPIV